MKDGKGIIKEYNENNFYIFKGQYINGERNGKVEEFDNMKKSLFEGNYYNNKRTGKGKEYYFDSKNKLKFEGKYLYDKKWDGKGYDGNDNIVYELKNGKGYIREYILDYNTLNSNTKGKLIFEGEYSNGKKTEKEKII